MLPVVKRGHSIGSKSPSKNQGELNQNEAQIAQNDQRNENPNSQNFENRRISESNAMIVENPKERVNQKKDSSRTENVSRLNARVLPMKLTVGENDEEEFVLGEGERFNFIYKDIIDAFSLESPRNKTLIAIKSLTQFSTASEQSILQKYLTNSPKLTEIFSLLGMRIHHSY